MARLWMVHSETWEHKPADYMVLLVEDYSDNPEDDEYYDEDGERQEETDAIRAVMEITSAYIYGATKVGDLDIGAVARMGVMSASGLDPDSRLYKRLGDGATVWRLLVPPTDADTVGPMEAEHMLCTTIGINAEDLEEWEGRWDQLG